MVCAEREHIIDGKLVEVKRAIPRSRIAPNGSLLPAAGLGRPGGALTRTLSGSQVGSSPSPSSPYLAPI